MVIVSQAVICLNHVRSLLGNHGGGGIGVARGDDGHDGGVNHPQVSQSVDSQFGIDDGPGVALRSHAAGPHVMPPVEGESPEDALQVGIAEEL